MGEGKKIVVENYPLEKLPADLQAMLETGKPVRIVLEQASEETAAPRKKFSEFIGSAPGRYRDADEIVAEIRALRDEWEDRG
jgi:hypothetical protein